MIEGVEHASIAAAAKALGTTRASVETYLRVERAARDADACPEDRLPEGPMVVCGETFETAKDVAVSFGVHEVDILSAYRKGLTNGIDNQYRVVEEDTFLRAMKGRARKRKDFLTDAIRINASAYCSISEVSDHLEVMRRHVNVHLKVRKLAYYLRDGSPLLRKKGVGEVVEGVCYPSRKHAAAALGLPHQEIHCYNRVRRAAMEADRPVPLPSFADKPRGRGRPPEPVRIEGRDFGSCRDAAAFLGVNASFISSYRRVRRAATRAKKLQDGS